MTKCLIVAGEKSQIFLPVNVESGYLLLQPTLVHRLSLPTLTRTVGFLETKFFSFEFNVLSKSLVF